MLTSDEYQDIVTRVESLISSASRQYYGKLSSKFTSASFTDKSGAVAGTSILASQGNILITPLLHFRDVDGLTITETKKGSIIPEQFDYSTLNSVITTLENETATSTTSSCRGACTGICLGTCGSGCNGCSSGCSTGCKSSCSTGCKGYCKNVSNSQAS